MQVSSLCKNNMVKVLREEGDSLLQQQDFDQLGKWSTKKGSVGQLLKA